MGKIGTVVTTTEGPSVTSFSFVIEKKSIKRGSYIGVETEEGVLIGVVSNIIKTNKYFESAGAVSEYNKSSDLFHAFPVKEWEYTMGDARALGVYDKNGMLQRPAFPLSPGDAVKEVDAEVLNRFLGLDQGRGICLGEVQQHDLKAKFNEIRMDVLGKQIKLVGRVVKNDMFARNEFIVQRVYDIDPRDLAQELLVK